MRHAFAEAGRHSIFPTETVAAGAPALLLRHGYSSPSFKVRRLMPTDAGYGFPGMQSDDAAPLVRDLLGCNHA